MVVLNIDVVPSGRVAGGRGNVSVSFRVWFGQAVCTKDPSSAEEGCMKDDCWWYGLAVCTGDPPTHPQSKRDA